MIPFSTTNMTVGTCLMLAAYATHLASENATAEEKSNNNVVRQPRVRFFYNDDGDRPLLICQGPFQMQHLFDPVDVLLGTGVTTLCYCACCGSDLAYYPSKVCSPPDWRETESHRTSPTYRRFYQVARQLRDLFSSLNRRFVSVAKAELRRKLGCCDENDTPQGINILGVVMQRALEKGLEFIPSLRMNDGHFAQKVPPQEHPLTSKFWMEHQHLTISKSDPSVSGWMSHLLDFTHQEVRDYRLATMFELIDGYAADGFEMDFTRHYTLFPPGKQQPDLITDMVKKARQRLDEKGKRVGKRLILIVRTPASLELCSLQGLDVVRWMKEDLVDYVVPSSPSRYICFDMPIHEFLEASQGTKCHIYAAPDSASVRGDGQAATIEMYRAVMTNYYAMGQSGAYLFNFFCRHYPFNAEDYGILRDISCPEALWGRDKHFMTTHESLLDGPHLPVSLTEIDMKYPIGIFVGEDLRKAQKANILESIQLRVRIEGFEPDDQVEIRLNEQSLPLADAQIERPDFAEFRKHPQWVWEQTITKEPFAWITFDITHRLPKVGQNIVAVTLQKPRNPDHQSQLAITAVDILTRYNIRGVADVGF